MEDLKSFMQTHDRFFDVVVAIYALAVVLYVILMQASILFGILAIALPLLLYYMAKQGQHSRVLPIALGTAIGFVGVYLPIRLVMGLILGLAVYIALILSQSSAALSGTDESH